MKLKSANGVGIESNVENNESMDFGIGDASVIIEILRNRLYSNPKQTLVQEYICNGRDASREAKSKIPLKITLPTVLEPVFKVRDFGTGISPDLIKEVFVLYGKSTKRKNDEQTGGFGIGAKSAWAYTDSFTIVTYVNGIERTYLAHIGENSNGSLVKLSENETTEPNGTEIQIAVHTRDIQDFINASYRATMFWDVRPEFDGITEPEIPYFYKNMNCVMKRDNWAIYKSSDLNRFLDGTSHSSSEGGVVLVVDGIPYKLSLKLSGLASIAQCKKYLSTSMVLAIHVGNGDVEVSASREAISDSEFSQKQINEIGEKILESIAKQIEEEVNKSKDFKEYVSTHKIINETLNDKVPTKKEIGKTLYEIDGKFCLKASLFDHVFVTNYYAAKQATRTVIKTENATTLFLTKETHFVYENIEEGLGKIRERMRHFINGDTSKQVYLVTSRAEGSKEQFRQLAEELSAIPLNSLPMPEKRKSLSTRTSNKGKICIQYLSCNTNRSSRRPSVEKTSQYFDLAEIPKTEKFLYVDIEDGKLSGNYSSSEFARQIRILNKKGYIVVALSATSKAKIVPKNKNFSHYAELMKSFAKKHPLTQNEKNWFIQKAWRGLGVFKKLDSVKQLINNKDILDLFEYNEKISQIDCEEIEEKIRDHYSEEIIKIEQEVSVMNDKVSKLASKYPLLGACNIQKDFNGRLYSDSQKVVEELLEYMKLKDKNNK